MNPRMTPRANIPRPRSLRRSLLAGALPALLLLLAACDQQPSLPPTAEYGANPTLPAPHSSLIPTIKVADAIGWKEGQTPKPAEGMEVVAFASGLQHPRWLYQLPNGDVLVAESDAPPKPEGASGGLRGWVQGLFMKKAGSQTPSANRITLLRDADGDGVAEQRHVLLTDLYLALRHGAGRRPALCGQRQCADALPLQGRAPPTSPSPAPRSRTCRAAATTTGPRAWWRTRTAPSSTSASAPTPTPPRTAWRKRRTAPPSSRSTPPPAPPASSPPACAIPSAWTGTR